MALFDAPNGGTLSPVDYPGIQDQMSGISAQREDIRQLYASAGYWSKDKVAEFFCKGVLIS